MTPEQAFSFLDKILGEHLATKPLSDREFLQPNYVAILEALKPKPAEKPE